MHIALMLRNVCSQTYVKIDINYGIDNQNMQEHTNNKELGIFVFERNMSIRVYANLKHRCPMVVLTVHYILYNY